MADDILSYEQLTLWEEPKPVYIAREDRVNPLPPVFDITESQVPAYPLEAFEKPFRADIDLNRVNLYRAYQAARRLLKSGYVMSKGIAVEEEMAKMNIRTLALQELVSTFREAFDESIAAGARIGPFMLEDGERMIVLRGIGLWTKRKAPTAE